MTAFAENDLEVTSATYTSSQQTIPNQPCRKITLQVEGAAIYYQTLDRIHGSFADAAPEVKVLPGFGSFTFSSPIYGFRWRRAESAVTNPILSYIYDV